MCKLSIAGTTIPGSTGTETLLTEAMQGGYVECNVAVILMIGVAGAGKTSFLQLVFNRPPLKTRKSTPLAKCAIRAVSISRAAISQENTVWKEVTPSVLLEMVGDSITDSDPFPTHLPTESSPLTTTSTTKQPHLHSASYSSVQEVRTQVGAKNPSQDHESLDFQSLTTVNKLSYEKLSQVKPVRQLVVYLKKSNRSGKIFEREWVYVADCGGQPQFIDLIPAYVRNVSGAAIFVKLNEELGSQPEIAYYSEEGKLCGQPYLSSLTHMQTIQNCLQVMQSRRTVSGEVECPELFFIGTHRDHQRSCKETLESKNAQLLEMLRPHETVNKHLSYYRLSKPEQLIYPVNAKKPKHKDREVAREFREDVMKKCKKVKIRIPLRWFILEQQLQHVAQEHNSAVLSLEDCLKVASDLEMDRPRLLAAIDYLDRLNLFKYLPKVLPNVVFTTSQVLLDKVSDLVELSHCLRGKFGKFAKSAHHVSDEDLVQFRDFGIVKVELLNQFPKHYIKGLFTSNELILILTNQLVFARNGEGIYFMPCVLLDLLLQKLSEHRLDPSSALVSPLLVYYLDGLFPASIFNSLVAFLQNRSSWKVTMKQGQPACLYKNCVKFTHLKRLVTLTLIYSFDYMEVHAQFAVSDGQIPTELCLELLGILFSGLDEAAAVQNYTDLEPYFGFFCSCEDSSHSPHVASFNPDNPSCLCCSKDDSCFMNVSKSQQIWLDQLASIMNGKCCFYVASFIVSPHHFYYSTFIVHVHNAESTQEEVQTADGSVTIASDEPANISVTTTPAMSPLPDNVPTSAASISPRDATDYNMTVLASSSQIQVSPLATTSASESDSTTETLQQIGKCMSPPILNDS